MSLLVLSLNSKSLRGKTTKFSKTTKITRLNKEKSVGQAQNKCNKLGRDTQRSLKNKELARESQKL